MIRFIVNRKIRYHCDDDNVVKFHTTLTAQNYFTDSLEIAGDISETCDNCESTLLKITARYRNRESVYDYYAGSLYWVQIGFHGRIFPVVIFIQNETVTNFIGQIGSKLRIVRHRPKFILKRSWQIAMETRWSKSIAMQLATLYKQNYLQPFFGTIGLKNLASQLVATL